MFEAFELMCLSLRVHKNDYRKLYQFWRPAGGERDHRKYVIFPVIWTAIYAYSKSLITTYLSYPMKHNEIFCHNEYFNFS